MEKAIYLDGSYIKHLVAKEFCVGEDQVSIAIRHVCIEFGTAKHEGHEIEICVHKQ